MPESINQSIPDKEAVYGSCKIAVKEEDCNTVVCGRCTSAEGCDTSASGDCSHAEGCGSKALGNCSHAEGFDTRAAESNSHSEGCNTRAFGNCSHAEGSGTIAYATDSHTEGVNTRARGNYAHAEGNGSEAIGESSHAQGVMTKAEGYGSFSEGGYTTARSSYSHAEGYSTTVNGSYSHAEGYSTTVNGSYSHTEGYGTTVNASYSHAEGYGTIANASYSHAEGYYTDTKSNNGAHIMGIYGDADTPYSWFLGGGTSGARALAAKILYTGDGYIRNAWHAGGTGYAELYSSLCSQAIEPGYFVTLEGECIRIANDSDGFILGISSVVSGFVANSGTLNPERNYTTNTWNQILYEDLEISEKIDKDGNVTAPMEVVRQPVLRSQSAAVSSQGSANTLVTLLGQVLVLDDGTCVANRYCLPNENGIATASVRGYKVMKRVSENQVLIFFR